MEKKQTDIFDRFDNVLGNYMEGQAREQDVINTAFKVNKYLHDNPHPHDMIKPPEISGETLGKGKHKALLIWNNIKHIETINFDSYDTRSTHSTEFYFINEDKQEIPIAVINPNLVTFIITP